MPPRDASTTPGSLLSLVRATQADAAPPVDGAIVFVATVGWAHEGQPDARDLLAVLAAWDPDIGCTS